MGHVACAPVTEMLLPLRISEPLPDVPRILGAAAALLVLAISESAFCGDMDPALERLVVDQSCRTTASDGTGKYLNPAGGVCSPDNASFAKLVAEYGFALAPSPRHSARTPGTAGFEFSFEADVTKINSGADYWRLGTRGPQEPSSKQFSIENRSPDSTLQLFSANVRKGFPFGLELGAMLGYLANTSLVSGGADLHMSLLEGFRTGIPAIFPDIAVGGGIRTVTGTEQFQLTIASFDAQLSKPFPVSGTVVVTPHVGYQWVRIFADSGLIDLTPNTDAINYCGYQGANSPVTPDSQKLAYDGQPVCTTGSGADFNNTAVFEQVRLTRHRLNAGIEVRFQMVKGGVHFVTDLLSPEEANRGSDHELDTANPNDVAGTKENAFAGVPKQWTLGFDAGVAF